MSAKSVSEREFCSVIGGVAQMRQEIGDLRARLIVLEKQVAIHASHPVYVIMPNLKEDEVDTEEKMVKDDPFPRSIWQNLGEDFEG